MFVPRDDVPDTEDNEIDVTDHELEEFKCFCFMNKPLEKSSKGHCESETIRAYSDENLAIYLLFYFVI